MSSRMEARVLADGTWRRQTLADETRTLRLEGSHIFADRYQAGFALPVVEKSLAGNMGGSSSGLGDINTLVGYEYLPDWNYNPWRPKGIGFLTLTIPTGPAKFETTHTYENRGRGLWSLGVGTLLTKSWRIWDANGSFEVHKSLEKDVTNNQLDGRVSPGWGGSLSLGAGYNLKNFRLGGSIAWFYEDPVTVRGDNNYVESMERYATGTLIATYMMSDSWNGTLSYADQSFFGAPLNTSLSKVVAITFQRRWAR